MERIAGEGTEPEHVSDLLPALVRGELERQARGRVERHLAGCAACREEAELVASLAAAPLPGLTEAERALVLGAIERRRGARAGPAGAWRTLLWRAAAAVALLLVGLGVWRVALRQTEPEGWSAAGAVEAWLRDLEELDARAAEARMALGVPESEGPAELWEAPWPPEGNGGRAPREAAP